jgi:hypothetical protein
MPASSQRFSKIRTDSTAPFRRFLDGARGLIRDKQFNERKSSRRLNAKRFPLAISVTMPGTSL